MQPAWIITNISMQKNLKHGSILHNDCLLLFSTCAELGEAEAIAHDLIDAGLAACVNIVPGIRSVYRWQDQVENTVEQLLIIKAAKRRYAQIEARIKALHSYELPEIVAVPITGGLPEYLQWLLNTEKDA